MRPHGQPPYGRRSVSTTYITVLFETTSLPCVSLPTPPRLTPSLRDELPVSRGREGSCFHDLTHCSGLRLTVSRYKPA